MEGWQDLQICASQTNIMNISNLPSGENAHKEKPRRTYSWTTQTSVVASDIHVRLSTHVIRCMRNPIWDLKEALGRSSGTWSRVVWLEGSNISQVPSASSWADIPRNWSRFLQKLILSTKLHGVTYRKTVHRNIISWLLLWSSPIAYLILHSVIRVQNDATKRNRPQNLNTDVPKALR